MSSQKVLVKRIKISHKKFKLIVQYFCLDLTADKTAAIVNVNRNTVNRYYTFFRRLMYQDSLRKERVSGEIEIDESYFGPTRVRGKRGRGAGFKIPVIGLLKRKGKVYTKIVKNCARDELMPVIKGKILEGSTIYTDSWKSYDGLILYGYKHKRIHHGENEFARGKNHVNGIESFWSYVKTRFLQFHGIPKRKFLLYLKESEWRFNNRNLNMKEELLTLIKNNL